MNKSIIDINSLQPNKTKVLYKYLGKNRVGTVQSIMKNSTIPGETTYTLKIDNTPIGLDSVTEVIKDELRNDNKMAKGGGIEKGIDLFEDYDNIPNNVQSILDKYSSAFEDGEYKGLENALKELNKIGYTFDYDLEGQAYDLRKTSQKGKSSYAKGGGFSSFMSNVKSLRKTGLSKTKEAYGKTKEYVKGKVHDQKKKIALDVIYDAKENLPIKREEINALDKAFRVVEEKYAKGGGVYQDWEDVIYKDKRYKNWMSKLDKKTNKVIGEKNVVYLPYQDVFRVYKYAKGGGVGDTNWVVEFHSKKNNQTKVVRVNAKNNSDAIDKAFRKLSDMGENTDEYSVSYSHKSNYSNGGGVGVKKNELQKGYVALKSYWKVASKPSKLKEVPTTTISSIDRDAVINYLNSLEVISEYLEGNVPYTNPDVGYGPIEENYLLYDKEEGDIYFIDTQGYNYPRYITRLAGYKPKSSEEFKLGGGVGGNKKISEAIDDIVKYATLPPQIDYVKPYAFKSEKAYRYLESLPNGKKYIDRAHRKIDEYYESDAPHYDSLFKNGGGVSSQFEYTIGGL